MITETQFKERQYAGEADLQPICDLLNLCDEVDKLDEGFAVDDLRTELSSPELDSARDIRLWEDEAGRLVAYGLMWIFKDVEEPNGYLYWRVDPQVRGSGIESSVIEWASERMREVSHEVGKPVRLLSQARDFYTYGREVLEAHGFEIVRYGFKMARNLDEPIPDMDFPNGYTLRTATEDDMEGWVDCFNQSFIDHWNPHPTTVEIHKHWLTHAKYRPELDFIATASDGTIAAFCFCWIDPEDNERKNRKDGWVELLGTRRGHRKIGLGKAILLAGMRKLKDEGMNRAVLGVDAQNPTGALGLYESVGFYPDKKGITYSIDL